jgi:tetratricopeptide (TPR) repeat protein
MTVFGRVFLLATVLLTGCLHRGPLPRLQGPSAATVPLFRNQRAPDKIYLIATLPDGKDRAFLLDTGSSLTTVSAELAESLSLSVRKRAGRLIGIGGTSVWRSATLESLKIGPFTMGQVEVAVDVTGLPTHVGLVPLAGIIGNNVWSQLQLEIDYPGNTLTLMKRGMLLPESAQPMFFNGQHPLTRAHISVGEGEATPLLLEIDTGARGLLLMGKAPARLQAHASSGEEPILGIGSSEDALPSQLLRSTQRIALSAVQAGGITIAQRVSATWIEGGPARPGEKPRFSGLLGHEILKGHRVYLDYVGRRFALVPSTTEPEPSRLHEWYLSQIRKSSALVDRLDSVRVMLWLGQSEEARASLDKQVRSRTPLPAAVVLLARLQRRDGELESAQRLLQGLDISELAEEGELNAFVNSLWLGGDIDAALSASAVATEAVPELAHVWIARADALRAGGQLELARAAIHQANKIGENPDGYLLRRAWLAVEAGDQYAAQTHLRRLLDLFPAGGITHLLYAQQARDPRSLELARQDLKRAQTRLHTGDGPLDFMAASWRIVGDSDRSLELMKAGLSRDCERARTTHSRDNCEAWYRALGHHELDAARVRIDRALKAAPERAEFFDTLAMVLEAQGHRVAAGVAAKKAARLAPDDVYLLLQAARLSSAAPPR